MSHKTGAIIKVDQLGNQHLKARMELAGGSADSSIQILYFFVFCSHLYLFNTQSPLCVNISDNNKRKIKT